MKHQKYLYDLTPLFHESQYSDSLYYADEHGVLTYVNLCGVTTTQCTPPSPVCRLTGVWASFGYGDLETQVFKPIGLFLLSS